ncbi:MAG: ATP-grasp domain-containing protein [Phycisphaerales bacterium]|nr:ATP-grasp domain-containing protein [Phycisphaerales bacterium]
MAKRPAARPSSKPRATQRQTVHVLFSCVGRRVELIDAFRRAARKLGLNLVVHGADLGMSAPAMHHVDRAHIVPPINDPACRNAMLTIVQAHRIGLIFPLLDIELPFWAKNRRRFAAHGCNVLVSSPRVVEICRDKLLTHKTLAALGIDTPDTWPLSAVRRLRRHHFPYYMKPRRGSAGQGNYRIDNARELTVLGRRVTDPIVQEFVDGEEYTIDVYTGMNGIPRCAVPRKRLEIRSGEVAKGVTVRDPRIIELAMRVARGLRDCRGVVTVQCIASPDGRVRVIEINPRFGGGAPLAIRAGADFPRWLLAEHLGRDVRIDPLAFEDGLAMLRYDQSVFVELENRRRP